MAMFSHSPSPPPRPSCLPPGVGKCCRPTTCKLGCVKMSVHLGGVGRRDIYISCSPQDSTSFSQLGHLNVVYLKYRLDQINQDWTLFTKKRCCFGLPEPGLVPGWRAKHLSILVQPSGQIHITIYFCYNIKHIKCYTSFRI